MLLGWLVAVIERRHARWYHYPFIHWYDVLGCIPLGGFRLLRALRIVSLLLRLQRLGLIDMRGWRPYRLFNHYYQLLMEDLSDRVMIKICGELQDELNTRDDFSQSVIDRVIRPRKQRLIDGMALRIQTMVEQGYSQNRATLERLVGAVVQRALDENPDLAGSSAYPWASDWPTPWTGCSPTSSTAWSGKRRPACAPATSVPWPVAWPITASIRVCPAAPRTMPWTRCWWRSRGVQAEGPAAPARSTRWRALAAGMAAQRNRSINAPRR